VHVTTHWIVLHSYLNSRNSPSVIWASLVCQLHFHTDGWR